MIIKGRGVSSDTLLFAMHPERSSRFTPHLASFAHLRSSYSPPIGINHFDKAQIPYRLLCNDVQREGTKPTPDLASGLFCYVPLHNIRYGILFLLSLVFVGFISSAFG